MTSRKSSRKSVNLNQSLTDSWGVLDHEATSENSTNEDEPQSTSDSEASYKSPPRCSARRTESPALKDEDATPRAGQAIRTTQLARPTPPRTRSRQSAEPQFIMPTPDATPIRITRRRTRKVAVGDDNADEETMSSRRIRRSDLADRKQYIPQQERARRSSAHRKQEDGYVSSLWLHAIEPSLMYAASVIRTTASLIFTFLKIPLAILLAVIMIRHLITYAIPTWMPISLPAIPGLDIVLPSPCSIPIVSLLTPGCPSIKKTRPAAYDHMNSFQQSWDRMLDIAQQSAPIPMQMSHAQAAIIDTRNMIKHQSQLPSKPQLLMEIQTYIDLSKQATYEFTDFGSHVSRTVDKVISMNRLTLASLDMFKIRIEKSGMVGRTLDSLLPGGYYKTTIEDVLDVYLRDASGIEAETDALIIEGEQVAFRLHEMENTLEEIRSTANRDMTGFIERQDELFAQLWSKLGGNAKDKKFVEKNIAYADRLGKSANEAALTVRAWLIELRTFKNDIIDLRARVNEPRSRDRMTVLEIEEQVRYVQDGLDRLYEKRIEGKKQQQQGIQGLKQYVQGFWEAKDQPVKVQGRKREIDS